MRTTLAALGLVASRGVITCQSAAALLVDASAIQQAAAAATPSVQQAQYAERRGRGTITKCYRDFVIGRYSWHTYRAW
jgi:hypothetical protein